MADDRFIESPPAGADGWREVWREDRHYPGQSFLRKILRRILGPDYERQRNFNLVVLDLLHDLRADVEAVRRDLRGDIETVQRDVRAADEALAAELAKIRELIPIAAKRNDALIAALDQKIETLAVRIRDVVNPVLASSNDVLYRRLEDALRAADEALAAALAKIRELIPIAAKRNDALIAALDQKIETLAVRIRDVVNPVLASSNDVLYRRLEDALRGSEAMVREDVAPYVRLASEH